MLLYLICIICHLKCYRGLTFLSVLVINYWLLRTLTAKRFFVNANKDFLLMNSGGCFGTNVTASVTSSVLARMFLDISPRISEMMNGHITVKLNPGNIKLPNSRELRTFCSISSAHGVDVSSSFNALARKIPENSSGKFRGQFHCLGANQTWAWWNFLENGLTNILWSYANIRRLDLLIHKLEKAINENSKY